MRSQRSLLLLIAVVLPGLYLQGHLLSSLHVRALVDDILVDIPTTLTISLAAKANTQEEKTVSPPRRKWAYAFLVAGCHSQNLVYRGFIYNAVVAASKLRKGGSQADIVVMVQMSSLTDEKILPPQDRHLLDAMDIKVHYLPKFLSQDSETFYAVVMEKFRVLELLEYSRVLFLDSDIMPWCSLDYMFELSEPANANANFNKKGRLHENVVLSWKREAATAGFFILRPGAGEFEQIQQVIAEKERKALEMEFPHWDEVKGWGHPMEPGDPWRDGNGKTGVLWNWHAAFADQGLLYYWTKYIKKSVSIVVKNQVDNWGVNENGTLVLENTLIHEITNQSCHHHGRALVPYVDFKHFTGKSSAQLLTDLYIPMLHCHAEVAQIDMSLNSFLSYLPAGRKKPWSLNLDLTSLNASLWKAGKKRNATEEWYHELIGIGREWNITMDLNLSKGEEHHLNPVGMHSSFGPMIKHIRAKQKNNGTAYAQE
jgi:hypothetical protein